MEKTEFIPMIWMFLGFMWMMAADSIFPSPYDRYFGGLGFLIMIVGIVGQEWIARVKVSEYQHFNMNIRTENKTRQVFFTKDPQTRILDSGKRLTILELGFSFKHFLIGKVNKIYLYHDKSFREDIWLRDGFALYIGMKVKHGNTDNITVDEFTKKYPSSDQTIRAKKWPRYMLKCSGGSLREELEILRQQRISQI
tara:strand:- start:189 stop:776 length:588 start_codon:yes stop_codon:yes gene_type:complete